MGAWTIIGFGLVTLIPGNPLTKQTQKAQENSLVLKVESAPMQIFEGNFPDGKWACLDWIVNGKKGQVVAHMARRAQVEGTFEYQTKVVTCKGDIAWSIR